MDTRKLAEAAQNYVVSMRREFHENPEESFKEFRTSKRIIEELEKMGFKCRALKPTGVVADLKGAKPGKCVALRADIDALSVYEKTGLPYASKNEGVMHACGHDCHAAMLLGAAKVLSENKDEIAGTVRFIFQPAEEVATGASTIIKQNVLDGVDFIYGQHIFSQLKAGVLQISPGPIMASADLFKINIKGTSSHGAMPDKGVDATVCAAAIIMNLQSIVSRELSPLKPAVVTVGQVHSGTRFNVVSGEAWMDGTVRLYDDETYKVIPEIMERIVKNIAKAYRCEAELDYQRAVMITENDPDYEPLVAESAKKASNLPIEPFFGTMGGEDFSSYHGEGGVPSCFAALGGGGEAPQHSCYFKIEEESLISGVAMYVQTAIDYLNSNK